MHFCDMTPDHNKLQALLDRLGTLAEFPQRTELLHCLQAIDALGRQFLREENALSAHAAFAPLCQQYASLVDQSDQSDLRSDYLRAMTHLGSVLHQTGQLTQAQAQLEASVQGWAALLAEGQTAHLADQQRAHLQLAVVQQLSGQLSSALALFETTLTGFEELVQNGRADCEHDRCMTLMHLGVTLRQAGRNGEAISRYQSALTGWEKLIAEGQVELLAQRSRVLQNLGVALRHEKRLDEAIQHYQAALDGYDDLIRQGKRQHEFQRNRTLQNLAVALRNSGQLPQAIDVYKSAIGEYDRLIHSGRSELIVHKTKTLQNLGFALNQTGQLADAVLCLEAALAAYEGLINQGQTHLRSNRTRTLANLAQVLQNMGQLTQANGFYIEALNEFSTVISQQGHWQLLLDWGRTFTRAWHAASRAELTGHGLQSQCASLIKALAKISEAPTDAGALLMRGLEALGALWPCALPLSSTSLSAGELAHQEVLRATLLQSLVWMAEIWRDGDPVWLRAESPHLFTLQLEMGVACARMGGDMPMSWALSTQGLRSQRAVVSASSDPQLQDLNDAWKQLDEAARQITGISRDDGAGAQNEVGGGAVPRQRQSSDKAAPGAGQAEYARWKMLRQRVQHLRAQSSHLLPSRLNLTSAEHICPRVAPRHALVMVTPWAHGDVLLAICCRPPSVTADDTALKQHAVAAFHWHRVLPFGEVRRQGAQMLNLGPQPLDHPDQVFLEDRLLECMDWYWRSRPDLECECVTRERIVRDSPAAGVKRPEPSEIQAAQAFLSIYRATWSAALRELMMELAAHAVHLVDWIPSGPFMTLPWGQLLADAQATLSTPLKTRLFPHPAGWVLSAHGAPAASSPMVSARRPQWGQLFYTPPPWTQAYLPWIALEQELSTRLWRAEGGDPMVLNPRQPGWQCHVGERPAINALLAGGHGDQPQDNYALAGLVLGYDEEGRLQHLQARDLLAVQYAERVIFSCCLVGRSRSVCSEPLGLLSSAFDYQTQFACGPLLAVDDSQAALLSLAFQFTLREAYRFAQSAELPEPDWGTVFEQVRTTISRGYWPTGFGPWLQESVPCSSFAAELQHDLNSKQEGYLAWTAVCSAFRQEVAALIEPEVDLPERDVLAETLAAMWARAPSAYLREIVSWYVIYGR